MNSLIVALVIAYLLVSLHFFRSWSKFFKRSSRLAPDELFLSLVILAVVTVSWPFVIPVYFFSYLSSLVVKRLLLAKREGSYNYETIPVATTTIATAQTVDSTF